MATTLGNRIHCKGDNFIYEELVAKAGLSPGMLIELTTDGKVQKHSTAAGRAERRVAIENAFVGPNVFNSGSDVNDATAYATGDLVPHHLAQPGSIYNMILKSGSNYTLGMKLISDGAGRLEPFSAVSSTDVPGDEVAIVEDAAVDLSVSGAVDTLHPVRFL